MLRVATISKNSSAPENLPTFHSLKIKICYISAKSWLFGIISVSPITPKPKLSLQKVHVLRNYHGSKQTSWHSDNHKFGTSQRVNCPPPNNYTSSIYASFIAKLSTPSYHCQHNHYLFIHLDLFCWAIHRLCHECPDWEIFVFFASNLSIHIERLTYRACLVRTSKKLSSSVWPLVEVSPKQEIRVDQPSFRILSQAPSQNSTPYEESWTVSQSMPGF